MHKIVQHVKIQVVMVVRLVQKYIILHKIKVRVQVSAPRVIIQIKPNA